MTEELARKLVDDYVKGWEGSDATRILSSLTDDCLIVESHGPTYYGSEQVQRWIDEWHQAGTVDEWTITSFYCNKDTAFFEWSFTCTIDGKTDSIDGTSIVKFKDSRICRLHEYRMTKQAFDYFKS